MGEVSDAAAQAIIGAGRRMHRLGLVPATAGNISVRAGADVAITRSGTHKGFLDADAVMLVDAEGRAITPAARPSAETPLHCQIYCRFPPAGAVLHGHSVAATVLSMAEPGAGLTLRGYELLKIFEGVTTHDLSLDLPIFDNDQDIARLASRIEPALAGMRIGYLIRGHGVYVWAPEMDMALARLEGLEFLLSCEMERRRL